MAPLSLQRASAHWYILATLFLLLPRCAVSILPYGLPTSCSDTPSAEPASLSSRSEINLDARNTLEKICQESAGDDPFYETDIVILGGGLAGLALSIGIATHLPRYRVLLIEKRLDYNRAGATLGVAANGVKALNELANEATFAQQHILCHGRDMMPIERIPVHVLPWWVVRDALLELAQKISLSSLTDNDELQLQLWNGLDLNSLKETDGFVELGFSNTECKIRSKMLVATDGVRSTVRTLLGLPPAEETGFRIWRGHVNVHDVQDKKAKASLESLLDQGYAPFIHRDGLSYAVVFNHHESIPGLLLWQLGTPLQDDKDVTNFLTDNDLPKEKQEILEALLQQTPDILYTKLSTINMDSISDDTCSLGDDDSVAVQGWGGTSRVTLIGDAAHACRPTDGQGANMAFEDACVLVRMLKQRYRADGLSDLEDFILQFENSRRPRVKRIHRDQAERALKQGKDWTRWSPDFMKWVYDGV